MRAKLILGISMLMVGVALASLPAEASAFPYRVPVRPAYHAPVYTPPVYRTPVYNVPNYAYFNYAQAYRNNLIWQSNYARAYRNNLLWQNIYGPRMIYGGGGGAPDCGVSDSGGGDGGE